jgi:putative oxidoreductase
MSITVIMNKVHDYLDSARKLDALGPLAIRLYLFFPLWVGGMNKFNGFDNIVAWFDHGLGLPFPLVMAFLATATELVGAVFLLIGFATRYITIPLMIVMLVAIFSVHWPYGWAAIADGATDPGIADRVGAAKRILQEHGNYAWLTEKGNFVILNNGIEFGVTYLIMLLSLFFTGAGKVVSIDYWIERYFRKEKGQASNLVVNI